MKNPELDIEVNMRLSMREWKEVLEGLSGRCVYTPPEVKPYYPKDFTELLREKITLALTEELEKHRLTVDNILKRVKIGMTREQVVEILGEPTDISNGTRKYSWPMIYKYGNVELTFTPYKVGKLVSVKGRDIPQNC